MQPRTGGLTAGTLELIRIALVTGVLIFGVAAWFMHFEETAAVNELLALRWAVYALIAMTIIGIVLLRPAIERARDYERAASLTVVAWAIAESPAMAGAAHYLMTGRPALYVAGTVLFVAALLIIGVPDGRGLSRSGPRPNHRSGAR